MKVFVDGSALVAMITGEEDATVLADRLDHYDERMTSALSFWEAVATLCKSYRYEPERAHQTVRAFVDARVVRINPSSYFEVKFAIDAYDRYGKGRHPAGLNMGDCFSYAGARSAEADLLYKGNDFALTDLA